MATGTPAQQATVERVLHEFKEGALVSSGGGKVTDRRQAIAIALNEAGESNRKSPADNRKQFTRTRKRENAAGQTKAALLAEAKRLGIPGRSKMDKAALARAVAG